MAVFTGRRTRRQIIDQALKKVGNVKILAEARVALADILENLYLEHEWPFLYHEASLTLTASTALPTGFVKADSSSDTALRVATVDGVAEDRPILIVSPQEWRRTAIPRDADAETPDIAMIDYTSAVLKPWPVPSTSCVATLVYKKLPTAIDPAETSEFDADVPIFPYHGLLTDRMEQWGHEYEHNAAQAAMAGARAREQLAMVLGIANPPETNVAREIPLDPGLFGTPARVNEE